LGILHLQSTGVGLVGAGVGNFVGKLVGISVVG
jgi:hypothetical protein